MIEALEDDQTTEEDWYNQAAALYRDITESEDTSERRAYVPIGKHVAKASVQIFRLRALYFTRDYGPSSYEASSKLC